ncbi:hypothetical protein [Neorhizobium sp. SOG26]|uniref:hypothetical protein n=1 Tax=Neorhizobium sp. SOG26 TaxID=2060726 RepID=UPI0012379C90|nr:hypothetical protein [Neorhizobium sp. SOG26]
MSIKSSAFGGVTLTGEDAKKFVNQVTYGRHKKEATEAVARGSAMAKSFARDGKVSLRLKDGKLEHVR